MGEPKFMFPCFLCGHDFQFGPHRYDGIAFGEWDIAICTTCHSASWDGVGPIYDAKLAQHLTALGITPRRNAKGWIVWPR